MWEPSQFDVAIRTSGSHNRASQPADEWQVARAAEVGRSLRGLPRVNWLLSGVDRVVWQLIAPGLLTLEQPVRSWGPGGHLDLPSGMRSGTLILNEVDALPADDQRRLLLWLDAPREVQVISTTSACMLSRIQAGTFSETLYYRLNIILVDGSLEDREDD
jgi:hypothetical protein